MIDSSSFSFLVIVILIALVFELSNGFNDAANAIATVVSTRVMSPLQAVLMAAAMNFVGAITGTRVAETVAKGVVDPNALLGGAGMVAVGAGVLAAALWVFVATRLGMPISGSHSLVSGVAGAGIAHAGWGVLVETGISKIGLGLVFSPLLGFLFGYLIMLAVYWIFRKTAPALVSAIFGKLQIGSAAAMAFSHGSNDAQKTMGIITLALAVFYEWEAKGIKFDVPLWVILASGLVMAVGTYMGGRRVIHTLGVRIVTMRPPHGFAAESSAAAVIEFASRTGVPVSTTHVITSSILGMGSTRRLSAVRWGVAREIVVGWILTFPIVALLAAGLYHVLRLITTEGT
jgi:PiT family inorganic phosphate transporter